MKRSLPALLALASTAIAVAEPPQKIDVSALPAQATMIDNVVVPVPSEIFAVLDRIGQPNWQGVLRTTADQKVMGEQPQIALQLGTVIAEGFIAVEAENVQEVKKIGATVQKLAQAIGVKQEVERRANAIVEGADSRDWAAVRKELDGAMKDVKSAMIKLNSEPLSQLVSLGGWIRGTEALTTVVSRSYTKDGAELLHQPLLIDYFDRRLANMPPKFKKHPLVAQMQQGVGQIRPLVGIGEGVEISEKSVNEVGAVAGDLIKAINSRTN